MTISDVTDKKLSTRAGAIGMGQLHHAQTTYSQCHFSCRFTCYSGCYVINLPLALSALPASLVNLVTGGADFSFFTLSDLLELCLAVSFCELECRLDTSLPPTMALCCPAETAHCLVVRLDVELIPPLL